MQFCPSYHLIGASPLPLDVGYLFLVGSNILLYMVVSQRVAIWSSCRRRWPHVLLLCHFSPYKLLQNVECSCLCYTVGPCWLFYLNFKKCWFYLFIYLFLAELSLLLCTASFSEWGLLFLVMWGFSLQCLLLLWSTGFRVCGLLWLQHVSSTVVAPRLSSTGSIVEWQALTLQPGEAHTLLN